MSARVKNLFVYVFTALMFTVDLVKREIPKYKQSMLFSLLFIFRNVTFIHALQPLKKVDTTLILDEDDFEFVP